MTDKTEKTKGSQGWLLAACLATGPALASCGQISVPRMTSGSETSEETTERPEGSEAAVPETEVQTASAETSKPTYANTISERLVTLARLRVARPINPYTVEARAPQTMPAEAMPLPGSRPSGQSAADVTFIVKIKDKSVQDEIARNFRRDREAMQEKWKAWAAEHGWEGLELVSGSYSGEIILRLSSDAPAPIREKFERLTAKEIAAWMAGYEFVVYSDPNYTASVQ